jgi:hypothetical protein
MREGATGAGSEGFVCEEEQADRPRRRAVRRIRRMGKR